MPVARHDDDYDEDDIYLHTMRFDLFFVKWYINLPGLSNTDAILLKEDLWYYLIHSWESKVVHTFLSGISPKMNVKDE